MKKTLLFLLLFPLSLRSQSNHTINIDGSIDFTPSTEAFATTSGGNSELWQSFYVTWDATKLYIGYRGQTPNGLLTDGGRIIHIYIDTDPQLTPTSGTGTTTGESWRWAPTLPFTANYHYAFKTADNSEYKRIYSSGWNNTTLTTSNWKKASDPNIGTWELSILRSDLGSPAKIYLCSYAEEDWDSGNISLGVPSNLFANTTSQGAITFSNHWLGLNLTTGVTPNAPGNFDQTLPVELTSFNAIAKGKGVELAWHTANETNNYGFEVERKMSSLVFARDDDWSKIGFVEGNGTTNAPKSYSFVDNSASGKTSYRLKQIDRDGKFEYSQTVEVNVASAPKEFALLQNHPNPFNPSTSIQYQIAAPGHVSLKVYDMVGREVATLVNGMQDAGVKNVQFDASHMPSGIYFYTLQTSSFTTTKKMSLIK